jgi:hypothetical protein
MPKASKQDAYRSNRMAELAAQIAERGIAIRGELKGRKAMLVPLARPAGNVFVLLDTCTEYYESNDGDTHAYAYWFEDKASNWRKLRQGEESAEAAGRARRPLG